MGEHAEGLAAMERLASRHDSAKWAVVTYLPFLWAPEDHLFLKPQVTRDYAIRVGHPFAHDYDTALDASTYASLLDLAARTKVQVSDLDMSVAMQLSEKISAGQFIAIAADRVAINNTERCARLDFLGHPAPFPVGPFVLATALQAPVLTIHCIRQAGRYHIYFEYLWHGGGINRRNRQQQIDNLMQGYVQRLQHYCLQAPWQWYNFYPFWAPQLPPDSNSNRETSP